MRRWQCSLIAGIQTRWMLKRIRCYRAATRIDDVIGPCSIPRNTAGTRSRQHIQVEIVADPPRNHMIRAGGISAQAEAADNPGLFNALYMKVYRAR